MDANGCAAINTSPNSASFIPSRVLTSGNTQTCNIPADSTKVFFDASANLMATVTSGSTALGNTTVIATIDGTDGSASSVMQTPSAATTGNPDFSSVPQSYLQRHFNITPANNGPANICLYISDAEVSALNTASTSDNHTYYAPFLTDLSNVNITQYDGYDTSHGGSPSTAETPGNHAYRTVITVSSITATQNPIVDGQQFNNTWALCFNVNNFSGFYIHAANPGPDPLPVTLVSFTANALDNKYIALDWTTAMEINNAGFELERSIDGVNYADIGWVAGHGNSTVVNNYQYDDMTAMPGIVYYYRLKQEDVDGHFAYSNIAEAMLTGDKGFTLEKMYPNPANSQVSIGVISNVNTPATITMTDMLGRDVLTEEWPMAIGYNINQFDVSKFAGGTYTVTISSGTIRTTNKLVITK